MLYIYTHMATVDVNGLNSCLAIMFLSLPSQIGLMSNYVATMSAVMSENILNNIVKEEIAENRMTVL